MAGRTIHPRILFVVGILLTTVAIAGSTGNIWGGLGFLGGATISWSAIEAAARDICDDTPRGRHY